MPTSDISKVKLPNNNEYNIKDNSAVSDITRSGTTFTATRRDGTTFTFNQRDSLFVRGTQTAATNVWTGEAPDGITAYYDGLTIDYFLPFAGTSTAATLQLGSLGAKPVIVGNGTTGVTTHYSANSVIRLTYIIDSDLNSGNGAWKVSTYYNTDSQVRQYSTTTNTNYPLMLTYSNKDTMDDITSYSTSYTRFGKTLYANPSTGTINATEFVGELAGNASTATSAGKLQNTSTIGSTKKPVYFTSGGVPSAIGYTIEKSVPSNAVFTDTTYAAGSGLELSGTTFNHSNSIAAGTAGTSSATSGSTLAVPYITYDAQGHITGKGTHTHTVSGFLTSSSSLNAAKLTGTVPADCLPSYVDDVLEYASLNDFPATGESGKIYIAIDTGKTYRWSGTTYTVISETLALGETSGTAYYGDKGKIAYDHSQLTSGNPHNVTATDIGLGNVENTKLSTWAGSTNITKLGTIATGTVPLAHISGADDLKKIEALTGTSGLLKKTAANTWALDTADYSLSTHTHTTSIASSTGTNKITLAANSKYAISAGGTNYVFTTPPDTNTTYTFANGTNGFTVTPSGGTAQTVTVTPSIENNITGTGSSGKIAVFNGANTLTYRTIRTSEPTDGSYTSVAIGSNSSTSEDRRRGILSLFAGGDTDSGYANLTTSSNFDYNSPTSFYLPKVATGGTLAITSDIPVSGNAGTAVSTTASNGTATTWARSDHIHSISSSTITSALGYTPYNSTNPNGYTTNEGTVTSVTIKGTAPISVDSTAAITESGVRTISHSTAAGYKHIPSGGSSGQFLKWSADGTATWAADNNNYVTQSASTTANWRKILLHHEDDTTSTAAVTSATNIVYGAVGVSVQPSTNTLRAAAYNVKDKVTLQWNDTTQALDFVFA